MKLPDNAAIAFVFVVLLFGPVTSGPAGAAEEPTSSELSRALDDLRSSDIEWRREDAAFRRQRVAGGLSVRDVAEYAEFVASLQRQKLENCEVVRKLGGNAALTGYDCEITSKSGGAPSAPPPLNTVKTEAEKLEGLEAELKRLESELDEELREKQQALRERQRNQSAGGGGGAAGSGQEARLAPPSGPGNIHKSGNPPQWSNPGGEKSAVTGADSKLGGSQTTGNPGKTGQGQPGAETPDISGKAGPGAGRSTDKEANPMTGANGANEDGSDDDIVMRQIREAAERETDPVLKDKLWKEYRKLQRAQR